MGYPWAAFKYCDINSSLIGTCEYTKAVTLHCAKVGGGMDQGPATQSDPSQVKSTFQFLQCC